MKAADVGTVSTEEGTAMVENSLKIDSPGGEREENLAGTSIQPHLPGNDVWYGPLRGEQKGGSAGYMAVSYTHLDVYKRQGIKGIAVGV